MIKAQKAYDLWLASHDKDASREGWGIMECWGSSAGDWQVQAYDDHVAAGLHFGYDVPQLVHGDDDAWRIVATGEKPHHVAARCFLEKYNPTEYAHIMKYAPRKGEEKQA